MKFTTALLALAASAFAAPAVEETLDKRTFFCVNQNQAEQFIQRFIGVLTKQGSDLGDWQTTVDKLLAPQFQEVSDSINSLAGFPVTFTLLSPTTPHVGGSDRRKKALLTDHQRAARLRHHPLQRSLHRRPLPRARRLGHRDHLRDRGKLQGHRLALELQGHRVRTVRQTHNG